MITIDVYPDSAAVARAAADLILTGLAAHDEPRRFSVALSGGNTPKLMYLELCKRPDASRLVSEKAVIFFSDERAVPPDSEQSNYHTAAANLFRPLNIVESIVHRMRGEAPDLNAEARRYERDIQSTLGASEVQTPSFDLIFLGMGPDGHTASLFPDHDFSKRTDELVIAPFVSSQNAYRLSFTLRLINQACTVVFLVTGSEKADALKKALSVDTQANILPAGCVDAAETIWMIDASAASELPTDRLKGPLHIC